MNTEIMFSSKSDEWETPQQFFDKLHKEFNFQLDVCATAENAKCDKYYTKIDDGLSQSWHHWAQRCWMNPPYGRNIDKWIKKAFDESQEGATVVCLIPARTDTKYWHTYCMKAHEIRFVKGRLKFSNSKDCAPFPSAIVVFKPTLKQLKVSSY
ncbi:DNA N-6-adenine-methyltransferase [Pseudobacteroides cellulosolvens]|uniref:DNA N-6-adenine-methyltransferase n=1 Tax=Pseudobacteroides cellulosolvens ATCC 35603 = DSM 2933 TaxID=398512 RepID=A0A0L6JV02_9FIRM|nr:DNA N-6-adenine-methyltransferase [Pseudobacteroides cellulosolvens]KNY29485.1 DNA N-6-adenine-methyltransferase [Pseudobacteroides cellulosolvens ATCC 35603 = DSM 2933]